MNLFENESELIPFIFRITDNGGATCDRFTITFCDGDYFGSSTNPTHPQGFGMFGEGIDVAFQQERVEAGTDRDLRWIDLPEAVRTCVFHSMNRGLADWLGGFVPPVDRSGAKDIGTAYRLAERWGEGVYGVPGAYMVRRESYPDENDASDDAGPFATLREAVLYTMPDEHDLAGPEYHSTVDLADTEGGPLPLWDCEAEPPEPEGE